MTMTKTNGTTASSPVNTAKEKETNGNEKNDGNSRTGLIRHEDDITLEDLAPDGGWGWMVALAMILVFVTTIGPAASFAIIFGDFLEETGQAGAATTIFNSLFMITFSIAGLFTNALLKKYSIRSVGIAGALMFSLPNVAAAFVRNVYEMAFVSFLQGIGLGLLITICNTNFNAYFVKRRTQVMSAAQVVIGLGGIVYPICIEKMMKMYGFRGTAAMTGALSLNSIVGMTMMHPVEWHARKPSEIRAQRAREREEEKLREFSLTNRRSTFDAIHVTSKTRWSSLRSLKEETGKEVPLLIETLKASKSRVASISEIESGTRSRTKSVSTREPLSRRLSALSASSLGNLVSGLGAFRDIRPLQLERGSRHPPEESVVDEKEEARSGFGALLEVSLLKNREFLNICLGVSFVLSSDFTFSSLLPLMMTNFGYTKGDAALAVTVGATAELASRILLAIFTMIVDAKAKYLFFAAMIFMGFAKLGFMVYGSTLTGALVMVAVIGVVRSWLLVPQPLVIIEDLNIEKFASAYGIFAVISGIIAIVFGPIVGIIKDWTNSFTMFQLSLLVMNLLFVVPWAVQFLLVDLPKRRKKEAEEAHAKAAASSSKD